MLEPLWHVVVVATKIWLVLDVVALVLIGGAVGVQRAIAEIKKFAAQRSRASTGAGVNLSVETAIEPPGQR